MRLLTPFQVNDQLIMKNRIVMAPMTRAKASDDGKPSPLAATYYAKRADAGLIITEGIIISSDALGYRNVPGLYTAAQTDAWRAVTEAVHAKGGKIFAQIWHVGRVSHPALLNGHLPISASATTMTGRLSRTDLMFGASRAATIAEIEAIIHDFARAAENAMLAGFDGVEIHGANGYLIDQFLHHHTNLRQDLFGGNPENMARFAQQVVQAVGDAIGIERVGVRLSPGAYLNEIVGDPRDVHVFAYLLKQLNHLHLAYVHAGDYDHQRKFPELGDNTMTAFLRQHYHGVLIGSGSYSVASAEQALNQGEVDLVAFGRPFIANPDFVQKVVAKAPVKPYDNSMLTELI